MPQPFTLGMAAASAVALSLLHALAPAAAARAAGDAGAARPRPMPPYRGLAVDRLPAARIQHVVFEITSRTTKDGRTPPDQEGELNLTQRFETWNSREQGRAVATLAGGRFLHDGTRREIAVGEVIEENTRSRQTCRRWRPDTNVVTRWTCRGVNDRDTAILEHNETGLAHHFRNRSRSFYEIDVLRRNGRAIVRLRTVSDRPDDAPVQGAPPGAPRFEGRRSERVARLLRPRLRLIADDSTSSWVRDGHAYRRVTSLRVVSRRMLRATPANRALLRMDHPDATVREGAATYEKPQ